MKKRFIDLTDLFKELNKKNITYCVLRNFHDLPKVYLGQDVDFYVLFEHKNQFFEKSIFLGESTFFWNEFH